MKRLDFWKFYFPFELGLMQGGVKWSAGDKRVLKKVSYHLCWWFDNMDKFTCLCGIHLWEYVPGVIRVAAMGGLRCLPHGRVFSGNALNAFGFNELTFTREEVVHDAVAKELGFMLAKLVRGEAHRMETVTWDGELGRCYPGYAWTTEAAAKYRARNPAKEAPLQKVDQDDQATAHKSVEVEGNG